MSRSSNWQRRCAGKTGRLIQSTTSAHKAGTSANAQELTLRETVDVTSLATFFSRHNILHCDFLKLDGEGCEFEILLNSEPALMRRISRIAMEHHDHLSKRFSHRDLLPSLRDFGFDATAYDAKGSLGMIAAIRSDTATV